VTEPAAAPTTTEPATATLPDAPPVKTSAAKEPPVRKSLFDRLMGR